MHAYNVNQNNYDFYNGEFDEFDTAAVRVKPESLDNLVKLTHFSRRELKWMYRGFKQSCPSGVVKEDKFKLIYAQFFPRGAETSSYAKYLFNSLDSSGKSEITFTDFVINLSKLMNGSIEDKLRWIFNLYDLNGDGAITRDELQRIICSVHDLVGKFAISSSAAAAVAASQAFAAQPSTCQPPTHNNNNQSHHSSSLIAQRQHPSSLSSPMLYSGSQRLQFGNVVNSELVDELFRKFDLNDDGLVTIDEFLAACEKDDAIIDSISVFKTVF